MNPIDREKWVNAFLRALALGGCKSVGVPVTTEIAVSMAEELGIALADPEPAEVRLARFVKSIENNSMLGRCFWFSENDYNAAAKLADEILASHGVNNG